MYLKGPKCNFFERTLGMVGLEAGENGIRPSLRKRKMISEWLTPTSWADVRAFCYLTPFLRRFIPGRAELVKIMKAGIEVDLGEEELREIDWPKGGDPGRKEPEVKEEDKGHQAGKRNGGGKAKKPRKREGVFQWTNEQDTAFKAVK